MFFFSVVGAIQIRDDDDDDDNDDDDDIFGIALHCDLQFVSLPGFQMRIF